MFRILLGALGGAFAAFYWHDQIRRYLTTQVPDLRDRAAEKLGDLGERAGSALDRARTQIDSTVRTSQDRLRSTGTAGAPTTGTIGGSTERGTPFGHS